MTTVVGQAGTGGGVDWGVVGSGKKSICLDFVLLKKTHTKKDLVCLFFFLPPGFLLLLEKEKCSHRARNKSCCFSPPEIQAY